MEMIFSGFELGIGLAACESSFYIGIGLDGRSGADDP